MIKITQKELDAVIHEHAKWLKCNTEGKRLNLSSRDASNLNFRSRNLQKAIFTDAILCGAGMNDCDLNGATFKNANLNDAVLVGASLIGADFTGAMLYKTNLRFTDLLDADFRMAQINYVDFTGSSFFGSCIPFWSGPMGITIDRDQVAQMFRFILNARCMDPDVQALQPHLQAWVEKLSEHPFDRLPNAGGRRKLAAGEGGGI